MAPGDRVCLEGNNQKQADFLAKALVKIDPEAGPRTCTWCSPCWPCPSIWTSSTTASHRGSTSASAGPQGARLAQAWCRAGSIEIGAIHTYLELFARYFVDLTPKVALVAAQAADAQGNLYTGPNTEDTLAIVEATAFSGGIVIAQVNELVDGKTTKLPRVDIPADWVSFVVKAPQPQLHRAALHARSRRRSARSRCLMAMMAIKGIYGRIRRAAPEPRHRLRHGGDRIAAADLRRIARVSRAGSASTGH